MIVHILEEAGDPTFMCGVKFLSPNILHIFSDQTVNQLSDICEECGLRYFQDLKSAREMPNA